MSQHRLLLLVKVLTCVLSLAVFGLVGCIIVPRIHISNLAAGRTHNFFSPAPLKPVAMRYTATTHYQLDESNSAAEFASLLPSGGHVVHIDDEDGHAQPYTVTLFHQLKCLDIIRRDYVSPLHQPFSPLTQHCLNYLHQTILCRPNIGLESTKDSAGTAARSYESVCTDWSELYLEAERNYAVWQGEKGSPAGDRR